MTTFNFDYESYSTEQFQELLQTNAVTIDSTYQQFDNNVTYSFLTDDSQMTALYPEYNWYTNEFYHDTFLEIEDHLQESIDAFLTSLSKIVNLNFAEVSATTGNINIASHAMSPGGYTMTPWTDVPLYLYLNSAYNVSEDYGTYLSGTLKEFQLFVHELGHTLGLEHSGDYNGNEVAPYLSAELDTTVLTRMSYNTTNQHNLSYAPLDMAALISMYGVSTDNSGLNYIITFSDTLIHQNFFNISDYCISNYSNTVVDIYGTHNADSVDLSHVSESLIVNTDSNSIRVGYGSYLSVMEYDASTGTYLPTVISTAPPVIMDNIQITQLDDNSVIETAYLSNQDDVINLSDNVCFNTIYGNSGNDVFNGFTASMILNGGDDYNVINLTGNYGIRKVRNSTYDPDKEYMIVNRDTKETMYIANIDDVIINGSVKHTPSSSVVHSIDVSDHSVVVVGVDPSELFV